MNFRKNQEGQLGRQCHGKSTGFTTGTSMFDSSVAVSKLPETYFSHSHMGNSNTYFSGVL